MRLQGTHHIAIFTRNFEEMERFYTETLEFPVTRRWDDKGIIFIDIGSTKIELIRKDGEGSGEKPVGLGQGIGINHIALHVESVDEAFRELQGLEVQTLSGPADFQEVRIAFFTDPDGNVLELVEDPRQAR